MLPNPHDSDRQLLQSLLRVARSISAAEAPKSVFQRRSIASLVRKANLLSLFFHDLLLSSAALPRPAILCFKEILAVLRRFQSHLDSCTVRMSRVRLALQFDSVSDDFHGLTRELSTLLDILTLSELDLSDDVRDLVELLRVQCRRPIGADATVEEKLRSEILDAIAELEREVVPDVERLREMFEKMGLDDPHICSDEIERLQVEIRDGAAGARWSAAMISLLGLVRYAKFVLFGASTPRVISCSLSVSESSIPSDFRCPISLELMKDPVVAASGQTYDRVSIERWIASGHNTCPKTGQPLAHLRLLPNLALKNLIAQWCRDQGIPFEVAGDPSDSKQETGGSATKAALEAAKMTASFLVEKLKASTGSGDATSRIVYELRQLAKTASENRAFIAEAGVIPLLVPLLNSDDQNLQVNAVTTLLNLSILEDNKKRIMRTPGALPGVAQVLASGATWPARENAAATLLSISSMHPLYRRRVGKEERVAEGLADLVRTGPTSSKRDGLVTILHLAGTRENIASLLDGGAVAAAMEAAEDEDVAEMAVAVLAALARRGAAEAVGKAEGFVARMVAVMRHGTELGKEAAASALLAVCRTGRDSITEELRKTTGLEWLLWGLMSSGSSRARRKAASLSRLYRKWAAERETEGRTAGGGGGNPMTVVTAAQT